MHIVQKYLDMDSENSKIQRLDPIELNINTEMIDIDIKNMKKALERVNSKENHKNIEDIIKYLNKLKAKVKEGKLELGWNYRNNSFYTYPINLEYNSEYQFDSCSYIEAQDEKVVVLDFINIVSCLVFEYIHRDLGYTHDDMEKLLESVGIIGISDYCILTDFFEQEELEPYLLRSARMESSPYISETNRTIRNYFNTKKFSVLNATYKNVIDNSVEEILKCILLDIMKRADKQNLDIKPIMISDTALGFIVKGDIDIEDLLSDTTLRLFGRTFLAKPDISIY